MALTRRGYGQVKPEDINLREVDEDDLAALVASAVTLANFIEPDDIGDQVVCGLAEDLKKAVRKYRKWL